MEKQAGLTLIEVMVVIVIIGIASAVAIPNYRAFIADNNLTTYTNNFVTALALARSQAISSGSNISVVAANDNWSKGGWNIIDPGNSDQILRSYQDMTSSTLTMTSDLAAGDKKVITFDRRGLMVSPGTAFSMKFCDDRENEKGRLVSLNVAGRTSLDPAAKCS